jgi:hypothetical protein
MIMILMACLPVLLYPFGMQGKLRLGPILEHAGTISELTYTLLDHSMHQPNSPSSDCSQTQIH